MGRSQSQGKGVWAKKGQEILNSESKRVIPEGIVTLKWERARKGEGNQRGVKGGPRKGWGSPEFKKSEKQNERGETVKSGPG